MLSIENLPPADPNEISLKRVDLSNPSLDDHNPIPKFSIRDYVFNARSKDVKTNWPFSKKSLQLCLEHGVKDLLPPFQCLDCVKNRSSERDGVNKQPAEGDGVESSSSGKGKNMNSDMDSLNKAGNIDPSGFDSCVKQLPVTINNPPQEMSPKTAGKLKSYFSKKPDFLKPASTKKCRLTLKVGPGGVDPSSNASTMVEPIVCPVCKKFSSSSNTTLNAHIDQCLSMDSPTELVSKSVVVKHRIKPRKTRLMVDIYSTAPHCTLEELDRRNGRIWSENPNLLPTIQEDDEVDCSEEKKRNDGLDDKGDEGVVYIDATGTKVRILNKLSDTSSVSELGKKPLKDKEKIPLPIYKKKKKHSKYLKLASQRENTCSYKTRLASRVLGDQEKDRTVEEIPKKDVNMDGTIAQILNSREPVINSGTNIPRWPSSKGTNLLKRRYESDQSSVDDLYLEKRYAQKGKGTANSSCEVTTDKIHEPPSRKQMRFKSFRSQSIKSLDRTFSSSRERMLSVDQSSSCEPKLSKSSTFLAKHCDYYNEKHLEHQRRIDEDAVQAPLKRSTVLRIKKKKSPAIISQTNESTEDHDSREISPSPRLSAHLVDEPINVELEPPCGGKIVIGQTSGTDSENGTSLVKPFNQDFYSIGDTNLETEDVLGNYFSGVDPITIPGPPGSFLPSPGRSSSDEDNHGNSSLTTSQVQSSLDHLETVDRDSSNSPKSANSIVSNFLIARSDLKPTKNLPQDEIIKLGFSDEITKSTLGFQDGESCCCSRKESVSLNCQESQLLKRRVISSFPDQTVDKQSISSQNNTILPIHVKPSVYGDFGSPSPSAPSPVLRLMGKNLVVVNNDENINQSPNSKFQPNPLANHFVHQATPINDLREFKPSFGGLNRSLNSSFSSLRYNKTESVETFSDPQNEVHMDGMNVSRTSSGGFPIPLSGYYNSGNLNPFHNYQRTDFSTHRGPHMIPYISSPVSPPDPMRWHNGVLESSSMLPPNSLASSPSINRARSSLYYSPRMS